MTAKIIVVANQKGGCGKTTLSMQLAGALSRRKEKNRILIVDADPQGSAVRWASTADTNSPFPSDVVGLSAAGGKVHQEVRKFIDKYDWIIIDCPPAVESTASQSALMIADLAIIPVIPSPPDLWAAIGIRELVHRMSDLNENLKARLVANMCQPNTSIDKTAMDIINDFRIPLADSRIHLRTAFRQAAAIGGTVFDVDPKGNQSAKEIQDLTKELTALL